MKEILLTKNQVALVDDRDFEYLSQFKWYAAKSGSTFYAKRDTHLTNGKRIVIYMHREILNVPKGMETDHIDHFGLNNQRMNLRICTRQENQMNRNSQKNSSSKHKGIFWDKNAKKWQVQINYNGETKYLGIYHSETDAALAYNIKASELFREFAKLNVI